MSGWEIHARNSDLSRMDESVRSWERLTLVERFNLPDTWVLTGTPGQLGLFTAGTGCILDLDGQQITSGKVTEVAAGTEWDEDAGQMVETSTVAFISEDAQLHRRLVFPDPTKVLTGTPSTMTPAYATKSGAIETVILGYVADNLGPAAPVVNRRLTSLVLPASLGRGGTTTVNARMDNLGTLVHDLAEVGRLRVRIQHDESTGSPALLLTIDEVPDVSADVRFGPAGSAATGAVASWSYQLSAPDVTRAVVWAEGEKEARLGAQWISTDGEALWGQAVEKLIDQRWTGDADELERAGLEELEAGATPVEVKFTVADGPDLVYRRDYAIGWRVGLELPGLDSFISDQVVREVTTTVEFGRADRVEVVVGTAGMTGQGTKQAVKLNKALRRVAALERST